MAEPSESSVPSVPSESSESCADSAYRAVTSVCSEVSAAGPEDHAGGVRAAILARPADTEEVAQTLRAAAAHRLVTVVRGGGTKLAWGRPPERLDLMLDLSRLDRVLDHAVGDLIVATEVGARLRDVQAVVGGAGQRLAIDETMPGATVGGTLVANASGPIRLQFGTMRDLLIGLTMVRADGVVAHSGGRVVKNVAGYDLGKLMTGSHGTLAVVTETLFRLHPLPEARTFISVDVPTAADADRLTKAVIHSQTVPSALEIDWPATGSGTLTVLVEGLEAGVRGRTDTVLRLLGDTARAEPDAPGWWGRYPWLSTDTTAEPVRPGTALRASLAISGLPELLADAQTLGRAGVPIEVRGSAGAGVVSMHIGDSVEPDDVAAAVESLRARCRSHGGSLVVLQAPAPVLDAVDSWGPVSALDLMRRVKQQFDPDRLLAPGRFVGGI